LKILRFTFFFCVSILLALVSGCDDPPNAVGDGVLKADDFSPIRIDTFYATTHHSQKELLYSYGLDRTMVGRHSASNQWSYEAWACLKFSDWPDSLLGVIIDTAKIQMKMIAGLGDQTLPISFSVHKALQSWGGDSLSYDSLKNPDIYYNSTPLLAPFHEDTGWVTIEMTDTGMVRAWMISNTDSTHVNDGLILRPTSTNGIKGLYSFNTVDESLRPRLSITYHRVDSVKEYIQYVHSTGSAKYISNVVIPSSVQLAGDSMMYIQDGFSFHGHMGFDTLQLSQKILIYGAVLETTLNSSASRIDNQDSLLVYQTTSTGFIDYYNYYNIGIPSTAGSGHRVYQFNVRNLVTQWIKGTQKKEFILGGYSEGLSFDLFTLYGSGANTPLTVRPKLIVTYYAKP
jgi:hypothetical protein